MPAFTARDRLWLLAIPLYLVALLLLHEGSHAAVAVLVDGAELTEFSVLPSISDDGSLVRPRIRVRGALSIAAVAAPYLVDLVVFAGAFLLLRSGRVRGQALWINVLALGLLVPALDTAGNYAFGLGRAGSDVGRLLARSPDVLVHLAFVALLAGYAVALRTLLPPTNPPPATGRRPPPSNPPNPRRTRG